MIKDERCVDDDIRLCKRAYYNLEYMRRTGDGSKRRRSTRYFVAKGMGKKSRLDNTPAANKYCVWINIKPRRAYGYPE